MQKDYAYTRLLIQSYEEISTSNGLECQTR
jgi:hypothetical protein